MLFDKMFDRYPHIRPKGVLHVGANKGQEAELYRRAGVTKMVFVEALPWVYEELCMHLKAYPGSIAIKACVSDVDDQEMEFNVSSNEGQSSSFLKPATHLTAHPNVKFESTIKLRTTRLDTLLENNEIVDIADGLDMLNMDLQGAELLALKGLGDLLEQFSWVYLEVNRAELYEGCAKVWEVDQYLAKYGFVGLEEQWTGWDWGDKLYVKQTLEYV